MEKREEALHLAEFISAVGANAPDADIVRFAHVFLEINAENDRLCWALEQISLLSICADEEQEKIGPIARAALEGVVQT